MTLLVYYAHVDSSLNFYNKDPPNESCCPTFTDNTLKSTLLAWCIYFYLEKLCRSYSVQLLLMQLNAMKRHPASPVDDRHHCTLTNVIFSMVSTRAFLSRTPLMTMTFYRQCTNTPSATRAHVESFLTVPWWSSWLADQSPFIPDSSWPDNSNAWNTRHSVTADESHLCYHCRKLCSVLNGKHKLKLVWRMQYSNQMQLQVTC